MAFDRTSAADLLALKNEVNNDPLGIGYNVSQGDTSNILEGLNDADRNLGGETGTPPLSLGELWLIVANDSATATQFEFNISNLFAMSEGPDTDVSDYRNGVIGLGDNQINSDINARTRPLSRAEVLFGGVEANGNAEFVSISREDWFAARDS